MGLRNKRRKAKGGQVSVSISPECSTIPEESIRARTLLSRSTFCARKKKKKFNNSTLVCPSASSGKLREATTGHEKALCDDVQENAELRRVEEDVRTFASCASNDVAWHTANDDDIDSVSYRSAESNLSCAPTASFCQEPLKPKRSCEEAVSSLLPSKHLPCKTEEVVTRKCEREEREVPVCVVPEIVVEASDRRSVRDVVSSFAGEGAADDQRAHDLSVINDSIENCLDYMARCCLRKDLMSLGVLKGVALASKTNHPALSRELQRLVECEARDLIIQETPKDVPNSRSAIDLLFDWFAASKDRHELARKHHLLRILVRSRNLTDPTWARLLQSISKILDVETIEHDGEKSVVKESNVNKRTSAYGQAKADTNISSCEFSEAQTCSASTSPTPSDPDHDEKLNTTSLAVEKNILGSDDLLLKTLAPMPKLKTRPRSISRHRATSLALIPPNERSPQRGRTPPIASSADLTVQHEQSSSFNGNPTPAMLSVPTHLTRTPKCQSFSMSFVASTSPVKSRQIGAPLSVSSDSAPTSVPSASSPPPVSSDPASTSDPSASAPPPVSSVPPPPPAPPPPPPLTFQKIQTCGSAPPPPPPPPPGVLGQPLSSPSSSVSPSCAAHSDEVYPKKKKTYTLLWQAVSQHDITNVHTVWNEYSRPEFGVEERDHLLLLFERAEPVSSRFPSERRSLQETSKNDSVFQLPHQKALNLEIILAKIRPLTVVDLVIKLDSNNMDGLSVDLLSSLLKYFPTEEEMLMFKKVIREDVKRNCDVLCWEAARRSTLKIRTELAIAREQILQDLGRHSDSTRRLRAACSALRSPVLVLLLHKCLQYGNFINQGTAISRVVGFCLSSLPSILTAKGKRDTGLNIRLVDLLAQYVEFDMGMLEDVITSLHSAKSITLDDIEAASRELSSSVSHLQRQLVAKGGGDSTLLSAYQPFLETAESSSSSLSVELQEIRVAEASLQLFLCANSMKLEGIIAVTSEALTMLSASIKTRALMKLRSSTRQMAGRETLSPRRRSLQPSPLSVDEMRQMFLKASNQ